MASKNTPVDKFIQAINGADVEGTLSVFAADAEIFDDGKSFKGAAIEMLCEVGIIGHHGKIRILEQGVHPDGRLFYHVMMDGDFVEGFGIHEPFDLFLLATLQDDHNKIKHLDMGDVDPRKPTVRAVYAASANPADPLASIRIHHRNKPRPNEGWVLVKMQAVGLNFHDAFTLRGIGFAEIRYPMILGNEGAGVLEDGTEVALYPVVGDADFKDDETLDPRRSVLGEVAQGTLAEYTVVPKRNAVPRPAALSAEAASVMGVAWLTAYRMIFTKSKLRPGQTMLVQGSSGGE
jgi:hypothetical protein